MTLCFTLLGPVGLTTDGCPVNVDRPRRRAVLAYLLLHANQVVSVGQLATAIWGGNPPSTARAQVQSEIWALRRSIQQADDATGSIVTQPGGYLLRLEADQLDLARYRALSTTARVEVERGLLEDACTLMREALALWRGPTLSGAAADFVEPSRVHLEERRLADLEWLLGLELTIGRHHELIAELTRHVADHPLRERLRTQLVLALYRCGRQPEALRVARQGCQLLSDQHGLDPGPLLRGLELAILRQDPKLDLAERTTPDEAAAVITGTASPGWRPHAVGRADSTSWYAATLSALARDNSSG
ncbi:AfsR/SARP family transcriptional regulator [Micromonospora okii]|uniref:AfsR/SARP family transcriptional regulator n=1 Tax=Micromonospora okii TaxID=1182970 RepID=UPI001E3D47A0|nr:AfsR/SARP family transcriptional regulator [Micromonospora okii]